MCPPNVEEYVLSALAPCNLKIDVVKELSVIEKDYPLFEAVNRAAKHQARHQGRIMYLEYAPKEIQIKETIYLVGKGKMSHNYVVQNTKNCSFKA